MRIHPLLIMLSFLLLAGCSSGNENPPAVVDTDTLENTPGEGVGDNTSGNDTTDTSAIAGLWDDSEEINGVLNVSYIQISEDGQVRFINYLGDAFDKQDNCYLTRNEELIARDEDGVLTISRADRSTIADLPQLEGIDPVFPECNFISTNVTRRPGIAPEDQNVWSYDTSEIAGTWNSSYVNFDGTWFRNRVEISTDGVYTSTQCNSGLTTVSYIQYGGDSQYRKYRH